MPRSRSAGRCDGSVSWKGREVRVFSHAPSPAAQGLREGVEAVWADAVRRYDANLHAFARGYADSGDQEDDLVQLTWATAWERRDQFRGTGPFDAWLRRICRTMCLRARASRQTVPLADVFEAPSEVTEEEAVVRQDAEDALRDARLDASWGFHHNRGSR